MTPKSFKPSSLVASKNSRRILTKRRGLKTISKIIRRKYVNNKETDTDTACGGNALRLRERSLHPPQEDTGSDEKLIELTFQAGPKPGFEQAEGISLFTVLGDDGTSVNWKDGDKVAIFDGTAVREFTATPDADNPTKAKLTGKALSADTYTAFYPYSESLSIIGDSITFSIPETQTATAGSFESGINPSLAQTTADSMTLIFSNLASLVKFTVGDDFDGISELTLSSNGSGTLSGSMTYAIGDGSLTAQEGASSVTLEGSFENSKTYYFLVSPGTLEKGLNISYTTADGKKYAKYSSEAVTFKAGTITDLETLSKSDLVEVLTNTAFIAKVDVKVPDISWTVNNDGTVSLTDGNKAAMDKVTELNLSGAGLSDLSGIEYFTGLTSLNCLGNVLTTLDVSGLTELTELDCTSNHISELDVSSLANLTHLKCYYNNMSKLNISGLEKLTYLDCSMNSLEELDVSNFTDLTFLDCSSNSISELDLSGLIKLATLNCAGNELSKLDVSTLTLLESLTCSENNLTELDVSALGELTELYCYENQMTVLDITDNTKLAELRCGNQQEALELTLLDNQKSMWSSDWQDDSFNSNVITIGMTNSVGASHGGYATASSFAW